jgi:hypothetical protein
MISGNSLYFSILFNARLIVNFQREVAKNETRKWEK